MTGVIEWEFPLSLGREEKYMIVQTIKLNRAFGVARVA